MRVKKLLLFFLLLIVFIFSSCSTKDINIEKTIDELKEMESYGTDINICVKNDRGEIKYSGKEYYNAEEGYRVELGKDRNFVFKGDKIYVRDNIKGDKYITDKDFDSIYYLTFIGEYVKLLYTDENIEYSTKIKDGKKFILITLKIPSNNRNLDKAVLWLDAYNNLPHCVIIYDVNGSEKLQATYENFIKNTEFNKAIFNLDDFKK